MTVVFGAVDFDAQRRVEVIRRVEHRVLARPGITPTPWVTGVASLLVGVSKATPLDVASDPTGSACVVGRVVGRPSPATWALLECAAHGPQAVNGCSGLYLACVVEPNGHVTLATDVLGFFPLYVWSDDEVLVFSSEPALIHEHPKVPRRISAEGMVGILLQGHMANGQTIWDGIVRPEPGEVVQWRHGKGASMRPANAFAPGEQGFDLPYGKARQLMAEALERAVARCDSGGPQALMLSGGMDSRLVAGHLARIAPRRTTAFTFGDETDIEVQCARAVSDEAGFRFERVPIRFDRFLQWMRACVASEQLSNTLFDFGWPSAAEAAGFGGCDLISGLSGDPIMGGSGIQYAFDEKRGVHRFERRLAESCAWGMTPEALTDVLAIDSAARVVRNVVERMRVRFESTPGNPFQKASMWVVNYRSRFHVVPYALRMSGCAWPVMPYCDREVLTAALSMPLPYIAGRRMQIDTLKRDFLPLARLPLDRNSWDDSPLVPTLGYRLKRTLARVRQRLHPSLVERRAYYRVFDINNAGWRSIREAVEPLRTAARDIFVPGALDRLLPPARAQITAPDGIRDVANQKTLCALLLLLSERS